MENIANFTYDIIIFTKTFGQHLERLEELFQSLRSAGLNAKPGKCSLAYSSLNYLGHVVGNKQLRPISDKIKTIQDAPRPETKKTIAIIPWSDWVLSQVCSQFRMHSITIDSSD